MKLSELLDAQPCPCCGRSGWMPIETAPKDGQFYLCADSKECHIENHPPGKYPGTWTLVDGEWRGSESRRLAFKPTHWMPRPEFPKGE